MSSQRVEHWRTCVKLTSVSKRIQFLPTEHQETRRDKQQKNDVSLDVTVRAKIGIFVMRVVCFSFSLRVGVLVRFSCWWGWCWFGSERLWGDWCAGVCWSTLSGCEHISENPCLTTTTPTDAFNQVLLLFSAVLCRCFVCLCTDKDQHFSGPEAGINFMLSLYIRCVFIF